MRQSIAVRQVTEEDKIFTTCITTKDLHPEYAKNPQQSIGRKETTLYKTSTALCSKHPILEVVDTLGKDRKRLFTPYLSRKFKSRMQ